MYHRPLTMRQKVRFMVALTILAWATQTLMHQWGYGAEVEPPTQEHFVPGSARLGGIAVIELRSEATLHGAEVKLKQVCRWSNADAPALAQLGELTIARLNPKAPFQSVSLDEIKQTLHDAGVNLAVIRFSGPTTCTIARSDVAYDQKTALQEWIDARQGKSPAAAPADAPATQPIPRPAVLARSSTPHAPQKTKADAAAGAAQTDPSTRALRDILLSDASVRLSVPVEQLQINFNPADEKVLNLAEPQFKFNVDARRVHNLGDVAWDVTIITDTGTKKTPIVATARAWEKQVVLSRPLAYHQVIQTGDVTEKRTLVDHLPDDTLLTLSQAVGQEASRDLKPGTVLSARMVDPVALVKPGQFITITLTQGRIRVKTVARAMEGGSFGQTVKVKNEATREIYEVVLTGPQEGTMSPPQLDNKVATTGNE
jgi:flagella basal body P-ring formation protein FlgA